ncbi:MAG: hypothetical protein ACC656_00495 [Candidatus Heimdallarchaeota archaeon]
MLVPKDEQRILDIQSKGTDSNHMERLAITQANRITDVYKSHRRFCASTEILGRYDAVTLVFQRRYYQLTGRDMETIRTGVTTNSKITIPKKPVEKLIIKKVEHSVDDYISFFRPKS